jgi:hypothetical protein
MVYLKLGGTRVAGMNQLAKYIWCTFGNGVIHLGLFCETIRVEIPRGRIGLNYLSKFV